MTKKELRAAMKKQNLSLSPEERAAASGRIFRRVAESGPFGTARCVAFFCALPDEPATEEALVRWGSARRIVVPRVGATQCGSSITCPGHSVRGPSGSPNRTGTQCRANRPK